MKKKTHEEYVSELSLKNPTIEVVDKYINANVKILHHCLIHDVYWNTTPSRALQGMGCELCHKERNRNSRCKTHEQYVDNVRKISPHINVVGKYSGARTPLLHKCTIHNIEWETLPTNILKGCGCYKCGNAKNGDAKRKSHEEYINEAKLVNPNIVVIGKYENALTPILHKCLRDGCEWYVAPADILSGRGCPKCKESHGEKLIGKWLDKHGITYIRQKKFADCRDIRPLPFDFYLPNHNVAIEYDGEQHYKSVKYFGGDSALAYRIKHDKIKNIYCENNNITLLRIPYYQNIEDTLNNFYLL